ncbi:MAG: IS110 family transposase [Erysipelotrichaceae bacterium]|nr:IS110 family transposase [Erysipelotrichaceae bacterium]
MYSIGIDCAKGKSTACIIATETGELIMSSRDYEHTEEDLEKLYGTIGKLTGSKDVRVVMEATGIYHWPVLSFLKGKGLFVSVINPLKMKLFAKNCNFRGIKTDRHDALVIASYGAEKWFTLKDYAIKQDETREKLRSLSRVYESFQKPKIVLKQNLDSQLEKIMPGIKKIITEDERLYDFIECFNHFDNISKLSEAKFTERLNRLAKKKGYRYQRYTPTKIYKLAESAIPTIAFNDECALINASLISSLRAIDEGLKDILTRLNELASSLPEYETLLAMKGVGYTLAPLIIAEIGDIRLYRSKKSLISMAGIDVPPYESGQFKASHRTITKKGNSHIRRHLYLVMTSLIMTKPKTDTAVYDFMVKKKAEGKPEKQVRVAGMRKFLHIYYARVKEKYKELDIWDKKQ